MKESISKAKELGQYFTPPFVADFMVSLITKPKDALILDPCAGTGVFLKALVRAGYKNIKAYEIDPTLPNYSSVKIEYRDFLEVKPEERYDVIIGNPPYVRWMNIPKEWRDRFRNDSYWSSIMNGLSDLTYAFIYHSVNMLKEGGELIFITPIFWTETVHGKRLRDFLIKQGHLELLINFNEMRIFEEVSSTIIIFKYVKARSTRPIKIVNLHTKERLTMVHLGKIRELLARLERGEKYIREGAYEAFLHPQFRDGEPWRPVPETELANNPLLSLQFSPLIHFKRMAYLGDIAEIGNGMVSGLDKAFQLRESEVSELNQEERRHVIYVYKANTLDKFYPVREPVPYIYVNDVESEDELKRGYPHFYNRLLQFKEELLKRYNYGRHIPWWHWVFPRNKRLFEEHEEKIFVPSKERYDIRGYFRFAYVSGLYYATQDVTVISPKPAFREGVKYLLALLNSEVYQEYIKYKGFTRGGVYDFSERPIARIPVILIDWNDAKERRLYEEIVALVDEIVRRRSWREYIDEVDELVLELAQSLR